MDIIPLITSALSAMAAVLAWAAKLWWSKEYATAKNETIKAKEAVIESKNAHIEMLEKELTNLREFNPMKLREYFLSVKSQLEEYNNALQDQIEELKHEISNKDDQIEDFMVRGFKDDIIKQKLEKEKVEFVKRAEYLQNQSNYLMPVISEINSTSGSVVRVTRQYPEIQQVFIPSNTTKFYGNLQGNFKQISNQKKNEDLLKESEENEKAK